ncbi:hypothetical protein [Actinacidiphila acidipaludis]|uniref:Uncharacterized protein n=1 Tax=Actinacidiphila acidipaludis TaxID=2873382 RepID=A0ABS7Q8T3_9ACTN|nr:hypothetical protein [Streptomyces acidipaludis]MBY8879566.1 hypothetical protein [Streptomyces acidipaludis]
MDDLFNAAAVLPLALPFLIRLAATPDVTVRADLIELLWLAAELTHPVDEDSDIAVLMRGREADHPERARCRAVFAEQARVIHGLLSDPALPVDVLTPDRRAALLAAAGSR